MRIGIIGGGVGGLCAAACLTKAGVDVELFERAPALREAGAGVNLWSNATRVLAKMGLLERCLEKSTPLSSIELRSLRGRTLLQARLDQEDAPVICMRRPDLLAVLHSGVPEKCIQLSHRCTGLSSTTSGATVTFEGRASRSFDAVIGADGAGSIVRTYVTGATDEPVYRGYAIWRGVAEFELAGSASHMIREIWGRGQRFGILPIGDRALCWYATSTRPQRAPAAPEDRQAELLRLFEGWPAPIQELLRATPTLEMLENDAADIQPPASFFRGNAMLIGDAAHPVTPNLGQGCCLALEDAFALSQVLQSASSVGHAFTLFDMARSTRAARIVKTTRWVGVIGQLRSEPAVFLRDHMPRSLFPFVFDKAVRPVYRYDATTPLAGASRGGT
jgi:2-polyprenyl-6-methoxyphenol hydroxylase-like FAD-dependent oxidoreductase